MGPVGEEALAPGGRFHEQAATFLAWAAAYEEGRARDAIVRVTSYGSHGEGVP
jgi:hypothetical protein